jgi:hypothetical protein
VPGLQDQVVAAPDGQALAAGQEMVVGVAAAGHPEHTVAGHQPSCLWGHPALRIAHQYLFHDNLLLILGR